MRLLFPILLALVLVPTALAAGPREQKIAGTISANSGSSLTINSGDRSLTCLVRGDKAQTALARWGVGVKAAMACKRDGDRLLLTRLARLGSKDGTSSTSTTTGDTTGTTGTTGTTTHETPHETPTTTAPPQTRRDARGRVSALGGGTITVTRDDGTSLTCTVTDGQAHSLAEGAPVGTAVLLVCSGDGDHPALLNLQRLDSSTPPPPPTAPQPTTTTTPPSSAPPTPGPSPSPSTDRRYAKGLVTALSSDSVTVKPDDGTDSLRCRITPASDSASAAAKLSLGAHVGIVCRPDGSTLVLAGSTLVS